MHNPRSLANQHQQVLKEQVSFEALGTTGETFGTLLISSTNFNTSISQCEHLGLETKKAMC